MSNFLNYLGHLPLSKILWCLIFLANTRQNHKILIENEKNKQQITQRIFALRYTTYGLGSV